MAGHDQGAGVGQAQALFGELESAGYGQRGRGQDYGFELVEEALRKDGGDVDGGGLQEAAAAAALDPIDVRFVAGFDSRINRKR